VPPARLAGVWKRLARLVLTASAVLMLAGLLAWIMA